MSNGRSSLVLRVVVAGLVVASVIIVLPVVQPNTSRVVLTVEVLAIASAVAFVFIPLVRQLRADATRLALSDERAEIEHQNFEELFRQAPDGLLTIGGDGLISTVNEALESMFGYEADELVGQSVEMLMPERFRVRHHDLRTAWMSNPTRQPLGAGGEFWGQHKDDTEFPIDCALNPCQVEGIAAIATVRDVTDRRQAEDAVDAYARRFERSNEEFEGFASIAAHDLQEPLRKVEIFADRIVATSADNLSERSRLDLERLGGSVRRMRKLIDDLHAYSQVSARGRTFTSVDLGVLTAKVVSELHDRVEETDGEVNVGPLPVIDADPTQMSQLIGNLITNALKFHRPGTAPQVTVEGEIVDNERIGGPPICRLTVRDNGIAIEEAYVDRIFSMFQHLHSPSEYSGTGIGLAVCRRIVERHGGEITVTSTPGEGTTFTVDLPVNHRPRHKSESPS